MHTEAMGATGVDRKELVKESLFSFITAHVPNADLSAIDEIILSYVYSAMDIAPGDFFAHVTDFMDIVSAYVTDFSKIDQQTVYSWMKGLVSSLENKEPALNGVIGEPLIKIDEEKENLITFQSINNAVIERDMKPRTTNSSSGDVDAAMSSNVVVLDGEDMSEQIEMLQEMFPNTSAIEIKHCVSIALGDMERAIATLLHRREQGQALVGALHGAAARPLSDDTLVRTRIIDRYSYVDREAETKEHRPVPLPAEPRKLVRYRDNKIVSLKGERFTESYQYGEKAVVAALFLPPLRYPARPYYLPMYLLNCRHLDISNVDVGFNVRNSNLNFDLSYVQKPNSFDRALEVWRPNRKPKWTDVKAKLDMTKRGMKLRISKRKDQVSGEVVRKIKVDVDKHGVRIVRKDTADNVTNIKTTNIGFKNKTVNISWNESQRALVIKVVKVVHKKLVKVTKIEFTGNTYKVCNRKIYLDSIEEVNELVSPNINADTKISVTEIIKDGGNGYERKYQKSDFNNKTEKKIIASEMNLIKKSIEKKEQLGQAKDKKPTDLVLIENTFIPNMKRYKETKYIPTSKESNITEEAQMIHSIAPNKYLNRNVDSNCFKKVTKNKSIPRIKDISKADLKDKGTECSIVQEMCLSDEVTIYSSKALETKHEFDVRETLQIDQSKIYWSKINEAIHPKSEITKSPTPKVIRRKSNNTDIMCTQIDPNETDLMTIKQSSSPNRELLNNSIKQEPKAKQDLKANKYCHPANAWIDTKENLSPLPEVSAAKWPKTRSLDINNLDPKHIDRLKPKRKNLSEVSKETREDIPHRKDRSRKQSHEAKMKTTEAKSESSSSISQKKIALTKIFGKSKPRGSDGLRLDRGLTNLNFVRGVLISFNIRVNINGRVLNFSSVVSVDSCNMYSILNIVYPLFSGTDLFSTHNLKICLRQLVYSIIFETASKRSFASLCWRLTSKVEGERSDRLILSDEISRPVIYFNVIPNYNLNRTVIAMPFLVPLTNIVLGMFSSNKDVRLNFDLEATF